ncbi:hypothetical protein FKM82_023228 [Ascaphus truei]
MQNSLCIILRPICSFHSITTLYAEFFLNNTAPHMQSPLCITMQSSLCNSAPNTQSFVQHCTLYAALAV